MASSSRRQGFQRPMPTPRSGNNLLPTGEVTDLATVRSSANFVIPPEPRGSRISILIGVFGALAMAAAIVVVFIVVRGRNESAVVLATDNPPPPVAPTMTAATTATESSSVANTNPSALTAPSSSSALKPKPPVVHNTPTQHFNGTPKPDCRIPYVVDDKGLKHFKVECL